MSIAKQFIIKWEKSHITPQDEDKQENYYMKDGMRMQDANYDQI